MRKSAFLILALFLAVGRSQASDVKAFRSELQSRALSYFVDYSHPRTGLVTDRAPDFGPAPDYNRPHHRIASIAATGFGLAILAHAAQHGLMKREHASAKILTSLRFIAEKMFHYHGWLYHFVDWETGDRYGDSEVSTVDTAWFLAGALYAGAVFPGTEIARLADSLYERVDFPLMMNNEGAAPKKLTLSMGWKPESGFLPWQWDTYSEHVLLVLLGLGHPTQPLPAKAWEAWGRPELTLPDGKPLIGPALPLFAHQYTELFVSLSDLADEFGNYFQNSGRATDRDRHFCHALESQYATYRAGFWGLSASGSASGYQAFSPEFQDGTVCPGCAGASVIFRPLSVLGDLWRWAHGPYREKIWGKYGFVDSLNLDRKWFDPDVVGITVGALYLALANLEPGHSIWSVFNPIPAIQRGVARSGLHRKR